MRALLAKDELVQSSFTESILTLCASGQFGVREAIAEAIRQNQHGKITVTGRPRKRSKKKFSLPYNPNTSFIEYKPGF
jgi:hypothetical protein